MLALKSDQELPHNVEAERAVLGTLWYSNKFLDTIDERLESDHFYDERLRYLFGMTKDLIEQGSLVDLPFVSRSLERAGKLAEFGGNEYLVDILSSASRSYIADQYVEIIHDLYLKRSMIDVGLEMIKSATEPDYSDSQDLIKKAESRIFELNTGGQGGFQTFSESLLATVEAAAEAHNRNAGISGVTTGLTELDNALGGLQRSDLLILAGRPSMGKTALVTNIAYNAAYAHKISGGKEGARVGFFSLEMSAEQLAGRIIAQACGVNSSKMRKGEMTNEEFERVVVSSQELQDSPLYIDDTPGLSIKGLLTRARKQKRKTGLDLVIVDYLQLVSGSKDTKANRVNEVSEITRGLKVLAKELDVPVIALSQLSRQVEQREDKRPQLADLRESGSIEQDADVVMFIYREFYYLDRNVPSQRMNENDAKFAERYQEWEAKVELMENRSEVIIGKQRHGPLANIPLKFIGEFTQFADLD